MRRAVALALLAVVAGVWIWRTWWPSAEQQVRRRLDAFAEEFNESTTDGLGTLARAARMSTYFTEDVVVDLGKGTPPIVGRDTLVGMAARLQPRTAAFTLEFVDVSVNVSRETAADVSLTATFRRRSSAGEESIDARELALTMTKPDGEWRVSRVRIVEAFR